MSNNMTNDYKDYCIYRGIDQECTRTDIPGWDMLKLCIDMNCPFSEEQIRAEFKERTGRSMMITEEIHELGVIDFGKYKDTEWIKAPTYWLEYLLTEECTTSKYNKNLAERALIEKKKIKGQGLLFKNGEGK